MDPVQPAEVASTNRPGARGDAARGALGRYVKDLAGQPLAARTRQAYAAHVSSYVDWLAERPEAEAALRDPRARDFAGRDFKRYLKVERGWAPSSVNLALAATDSFNRFLGLGPAVVTRERLAQSAPRALDEQQQRDLLRTAEDATPRDRAIIVLLLHTGLRLSELVALDVGDVRTSARKGLVIVRSGKGDAFREVPLNTTARAVVDAWRKARAQVAADDEPALLVGRGGRRLTPRAVDLVVRKVARAAGLELSAHVLRHTCITKLVRKGSDVVLVAELAGHRRLETTRRYSLPSRADRQLAMDGLEIED
jgi:site-specific recombinase XerD